MNIVEVCKLSKKFKVQKKFVDIFKKGNSVFALKDINLQIKKGEIFCLLGPNGAGKTTLIKILCSLMLPDEGQVYINGIDITRDEKVKSSIGLAIANERSFYWRITGRQNLEFFGTLFNLFGNRLKDRIKEISELLEIENELDRHFLNYSTGIKQRFNIARALLHNPDILFLDDPSRDVDIPTKNKILDFIKKVLNEKQGKTIFFVSHRADEIDILCDRLCIIDKGRIKAIGTIAELRRISGLNKIEDFFNYYIETK